MNNQENSDISLEKFSDLLGLYNKLLKKHEKLEVFTKNKIFENANSLKNLNSTLSSETKVYKKTIQELEQNIQEHTSSTLKMKKELSSLNRYVSQIEEKNFKLETKMTIINSYQVPFQNILKNEIYKAKYEKLKLHLAVIKVDNSKHIEEKLNTATNEDILSLGVFNFIKKSLSPLDIVYYYKPWTYLITIVDKDESSCSNILSNIGIKKTIHKTNITMSSCFHTIKEQDEHMGMIENILEAFDKNIHKSDASKVINLHK